MNIRLLAIIPVLHGNSRADFCLDLANFSSNVKLEPVFKSANGSKAILRLPVRLLATSGLTSFLDGVAGMSGMDLASFEFGR